MQRLLTLFLSLSLFLSSCLAPRPQRPSGQVGHVVLLWLKEPGNAVHRQKLLQSAETFRSIPGLLRMQSGVCLPSPRPIVDSSFDAAFVMEFASPAAMRAYLAHPQHTTAVQTVLQPLVKEVLVYDFISL